MSKEKQEKEGPAPIEGNVLVEDIPATERVKAVGVIHRFGTRAQKRAISAGRFTKQGVIALGRGTKNQITQPYSTLKQVAAVCALGLVVAGAFIMGFYLALYIILATNSLLLTLLGVFAATVLYQVCIAGPIARAIEHYSTNARIYEATRQLDTLQARFSGLDLRGMAAFGDFGTLGGAGV